jgi:DNA polymerase-3 subunit epsilon
MSRPKTVCIIDVESSGLQPALHEVVESSFWRLDTGARDTFIPPHTLINADPEALAINRYWERGLDDQTQWDHDGSQLRSFHAALTGCLIVGSNPGFDVDFLTPLFVRSDLSLAPFAYRPLDIGTYAAGVLGRPIGDRVGLTQLCNILGIPAGDHSSENDVTATGRCLIELQYRANLQRTAS